VRRLVLVLPAIFALAPLARAGDAAEPWRDPLPAREIERPLALPRGWVALDIGFEEHVGRGRWTANGRVERFDHVRWARWAERVHLGWGVSRRLAVWGEIPLLQERLTDDRSPADTVFGVAPGDLRLGVRVQVLHQEAPSSSATVDAWLRIPTATARPGARVGTTREPRPLVFGTGTPDAYLGGAWRRAFGPVGVTARLGWLHRFASPVSYAYDGSPGADPLRVAPGDQLRAAANVILQAGPLVIGAAPAYTYRLTTRIGERQGFFTRLRDLRAVAGSAGSQLDLRLDLRVQVSRGLAVGRYRSWRLLGEDLDFFPLEGLEPTWGPDFGGYVHVRL